MCYNTNSSFCFDDKNTANALNVSGQMYHFLSPGHKDYESEIKKKCNSTRLLRCPNTINGHNRCPLCNRLFFCQLLWNLHMKNHDGRHAYGLNIQFIRHDSNHAVSVKNRISHKPFVCRRCCIRFVHFSNLQCHCLLYHASKNSRASELRVRVQRKHLTFAKHHEIRNFRDCRKSRQRGKNFLTKMHMFGWIKTEQTKFRLWRQWWMSFIVTWRLYVASYIHSVLYTKHQTSVTVLR